MVNPNMKLRIENSINSSGIIPKLNSIPILKDSNYYIQEITLDGDAPKQFIKAYIFHENSNFRKSNKSSWPAYIAKTAEKWYPVESVVEFLINRIGQVLGLNMNEVELVRGNGQIRFLSKYFLNANEKLIHGAEICGEHLGDTDFANQIANDKKNARELFTFEFIKEAIESVFPTCYKSILIDLVKMIIFDALTGNNDRHFYNWGIIGNTKITKSILKLSPIYDSARGLTWNIPDDEIIRWGQLDPSNKKFEKYINLASPRISYQGNDDANHLDLVKCIIGINIEYCLVTKELSSEINEKKIIELINNEFSDLFIPERITFIIKIIKKRFKLIREAISC
jgi:hypothetical protein